MSVRSAGIAETVDRIERADGLDPIVTAARRAVRAALRPTALRDALHGVRLGHPVHPVLTDVPIGSWSAAAILDAVPGTGNAAALLITVGCVGYLPTALAGWADWAELHDDQQRVGLVHALVAASAFGCYVASLSSRRAGNTVRGKAWSYLGFALVNSAGYLGGHLAYRQAAGASRVESIPRTFPAGWHPIGDLDDLPDGGLVRRTVAGTDLVVVRRGRHVNALADTCSHLGTSLARGAFAAIDGQGCVRCPAHGSTFRLSDGAVVHGPATAPAPRFDVRIVRGEVQIMLSGAR
ncbi:MAG TPA: Rieske (2Fe-2S) protein [Mycobacteriales bacterium]|nr:Rieske (2Fe-2S) protein [Mycobacteriales bacterium]